MNIIQFIRFTKEDGKDDATAASELSLQFWKCSAALARSGETRPAAIEFWTVFLGHLILGAALSHCSIASRRHIPS